MNTFNILCCAIYFRLYFDEVIQPLWDIYRISNKAYPICSKSI